MRWFWTELWVGWGAGWCGLEGWDFKSPAALYLMGHLKAEAAGKANEFRHGEVSELLSQNFHVRNPSVYDG